MKVDEIHDEQLLNYLHVGPIVGFLVFGIAQCY